jgi:hypothetical protein
MDHKKRLALWEFGSFWFASAERWGMTAGGKFATPKDRFHTGEIEAPAI